MQVLAALSLIFIQAADFTLKKTIFLTEYRSLTRLPPNYCRRATRAGGKCGDWWLCATMVACWKENGTVHVGPGGREEHSSLNKCYLLNCTEVRFSITVLAVRVAKVNIEKDLLHEWPR